VASPFALTRPATEALEPVDGKSPLARWLALDVIVCAYVAATVLVVFLGRALVPNAGTITIAHLGGLALYGVLRRGSANGPALRLLFCAVAGWFAACVVLLALWPGSDLSWAHGMAALAGAWLGWWATAD